jgi:hypothetical protein
LIDNSTDDDYASKDLQSFSACVEGDVAAAVRQLASEDNPFHRRTLVRTLFAAVEGFAYMLKNELLESGDTSVFSAAELAMLREEAYAVDSKGEAYTQPKFVPTDVNFRFALNMYVRETGTPFKPRLGDGGWEAFKQALKIRHRLVHPKSTESMIVHDDELKTVFRAYDWFHVTLIECMESVNVDLKASVEKLRQQVTQEEIGDASQDEANSSRSE